MDSIDTIRRYIGDTPKVEQEEATGNGSRLSFKTENAPIVDDSVSVWVDGVLQVEDNDYTVDYTLGIIVFDTAPADGKSVEILYQWTMVEDDFITDRLSEYEDNEIQAAIACLLAMASNYSLLAKTVQMGGYSKSETQIAENLRAQARALEERDIDEAEAFSNIDWQSGFGDAVI